MERVDGAVARHGAGRRHQGLPGHLAAEDALLELVGGAAAEDVDLDGLEVEEPHKVLEGGRHRRGVSRTGSLRP